MLTDIELLKRILLAAGIGAMLGLEREVRQKSAGLRTNILIGLGSAMFTILSIEFGAGSATDRTRIAAQIVTGVGFLGMGAIVRTRGTSVHGLTTAATVWVNAALGMAAGGGSYHAALIGAAVTLVVLVILPPIESAFDRRFVTNPGRGRPTDA